MSASFSFLLTSAALLTSPALAGPLCATLSWHHWNQNGGGGKYYITPHCNPGETECSERTSLDNSHWDNQASGFKVEPDCALTVYCGGYAYNNYKSHHFVMPSPDSNNADGDEWKGPYTTNLGGSWNDCISEFYCKCTYDSVADIPADFHGGRRLAEAGAAQEPRTAVTTTTLPAPHSAVTVDASAGTVSLTGSVSMEALLAAIERVEQPDASSSEEEARLPQTDAERAFMHAGYAYGPAEGPDPAREAEFERLLAAEELERHYAEDKMYQGN